MTSESSSPAGSLRKALSHRGFGRFLTATIVSSAGDFLNIVGLVVLIYRATGSAAWLGAAAFLRVISWAAATAAGGVVADRYDRRKLLVGLNAAAGVVAFGLVAAARFDAAIVVVIALSMMLDFTTGLVNPSFAAAVPAVVGEEDVAAANAAVTTVEQVSVVAGPALGAVLVAVFSPELAFFGNALTFMLAAALFRGVPAGDNVTTGDGPPPPVGPTMASSAVPGVETAGRVSVMGEDETMLLTRVATLDATNVGPAEPILSVSGTLRTPAT